MARIDNMQDREFERELTRLFTDFEALKVGNQLVGPDSVQTNLVESGVADINASIAPYAVKTWRVTYTPTRMKSPFANITYNFMGDGAGFAVVNYMPDIGNSSSASQAWLWTYANDANSVTLTVYFSIKSVDTGTLSVVAI